MNTITLSLSMPDRAALGRITANIRDVATDIVDSTTEPEALPSRSCAALPCVGWTRRRPQSSARLR